MTAVQPLRAVTIDGPVERAELGFVLPHEHLTIDTTALNTAEGPLPPDSAITMGALSQLRRHRRSIATNAVLDDDAAVIEDLRQFVAAGGRTVVDLTPIGMGRDLGRYRRMAADSGARIIAATGYYLSYGHRGRVAGRSAQELADEFVAELVDGVDGARCGVIGEIGMSADPTPDEWTVLAAGLLAHARTGAPLWVHVSTMRPVRAVLDFLEAHASRFDNVVMCHMDYDLHDLTLQQRALEMGLNVEFDLFAFPVWRTGMFLDLPTDTDRVRTLADLADEGYADQLFCSHDVHMKTQLTTYGGYGFAHLPLTVAGTFAEVTGSRELLDRFAVENTARVLCWDATPDGR